MTKCPNWPPTKGIKSNAIKMSQVKDQTVTAGKGTVSTTLGKQDEARRGEANVMRVFHLGIFACCMWSKVKVVGHARMPQKKRKPRSESRIFTGKEVKCGKGGMAWILFNFQFQQWTKWKAGWLSTTDTHAPKHKHTQWKRNKIDIKMQMLLCNACGQQQQQQWY